MAADQPQSYYITEAWNNLPKYVCPACGYDTLRVEQIEDHQQHCARFADMVAAQNVQATPTDADAAPDAEPVSVSDEPEEPDEEPQP